MKTAFSKDSPVGRLFEEIKTISHSKGISIPQLEERMDTGYVEDPFYEDRLLNEKGILSKGEVLEYAYRFSEYYPYLHKHGFPVPFAMNDFIPNTTRDESVREEIFQAVKKMKEKITVEEGLHPDSDEYELALARAIYDWCLTTMKGFSSQEEFVRERTALEAYIDKKGECTERSSILYYILKIAGFNPVFYWYQGDLPEETLRNFFGFYWSPKPEPLDHAFVGIFLSSSQRRVNIDVTLGKFDTSFKGVKALTARQFAAFGYLLNKMGMSESEDVLPVYCGVAPLSYDCLHATFLIGLREEPSVEGEKMLSNIRGELLALYPYSFPIVSFAERGGGEFHLTVDNEPSLEQYTDQLDTVANDFPGYVAERYAELAEIFIKIVEKGKKQTDRNVPDLLLAIRKGIESAKKSLLLQSNRYYCFWALEYFYAANPSFDSARGLMRFLTI